MLPTTVNALFILIGSLAGLLLRRGINEKLKLAILDAMGLSAFGIGIHSLVNGMDQSGYPVLFIVSLAIGALIGNWIDFGLRLERLVARFQSKEAPARSALTASSRRSSSSASAPLRSSVPSRARSRTTALSSTPTRCSISSPRRYSPRHSENQ